ncbi:MAG: hypothetical protein H7245_24680 [Candidatus Saccharibacteria bacterium]|nr:hypothetical protein [Pseudorhodobacter sp.]
MTVVLDNGVLRAQVTPGIGGSVLSLRHVTSGLSVLGQVPWDAMPLP